MRHLRVVLILALCAVPASAQTAPANDGPAVWQAVAQGEFDPAKFARVGGITLERDRIQITLTSGAIQFTKPVAGVVYGAAFRGTGRIRVTAPNSREEQQLEFLTGKKSVELDFSDAILSFSDTTYSELAEKLHWEPVSADPGLAGTFQERLRFRENYGAEVLPRLVQSILSLNKKETEFFHAELKTREKGWVFATVDAMDPEEIAVGRWLQYGGARSTDLWMSFPRGNRTHEEAWRNPTARLDVLPEDYAISARVTHGAELTARAVVKFRPQWPGERMATFVLDSNLRVEKARDPATDESLAMTQPPEHGDTTQSHGEYVSVFFSQPLETGKLYELELSYRGKRVVRQMGPGVYFCQSFGWYPAKDNFALRTNFQLEFRNPKQYTLVATGLKTDERQDDNETVTSWQSEKPQAVAGFAYGTVKIEKAAAGPIQVEVFANKEPDDQMQGLLRQVANVREIALGTMTPAAMAGQIAAEAANSIRLFEAYFGPYPYKRLAISTIPYRYGQGWPALIYLSALSFMDSFQRQQFGFDQRAEKEITDFFRAHETSHQWWGHKVAWKSYHDQWLSEGFAEFSGNLYLQKRSGNKEYLDRLQMARKNIVFKDRNGHPYTTVGPIWMGTRLNSSESGAYGVLVYEKGGFVLHMLRMMLINPRDPQDPEGRFKAMMKEFTAKFDNAAASTEDFKAVAEKHMIPDMNLDKNGRLDWFFNQYVYGTGLPTYDFKYTVTDAGGGNWKLSITVTQSGVPGGWKDVLPLYMEVNKNLFRVGTINVMQPVVTIEEVMPFKPEKVVLCANEDTIGFIKQ